MNLGEKSVIDVLTKDSLGALGIDWLSWNLVWVVSIVGPIGLIFLPVLINFLLDPAETMLDVRSKPGYVKREFRQPGQTNPSDDKAPPEGNQDMPKLNDASIVTN